MKALVFIALQNMKKKKGDTIVFFFLIMLAAVLFYTSISVFLGMDTVLDKAYEKANTADLLFMSSADEEIIREKNNEIENVKSDYEKQINDMKENYQLIQVQWK